MFQINFWYNKGNNDQNKVEHIATRGSNCGKETVLSMDNMNTKYKDIITSFVLNTVLHHVGMSCIIKIKNIFNMIWTSFLLYYIICAWIG